jgi:hypothetical protein
LSVDVVDATMIERSAADAVVAPTSHDKAATARKRR